MQDGQVRFSTEFNDLPLTADDIRKRVTMYVSTRLNAHDGRMVANNDTSLVCATVDSLVYKKQALAVYITYMRYNLAFDYANGYCRVTVRDNRVAKDFPARTIELHHMRRSDLAVSDNRVPFTVEMCGE